MPLPDDIAVCHVYFRPDRREPCNIVTYWGTEPALSAAVVHDAARELCVALYNALLAPIKAWMAEDSHFDGVTTTLAADGVIGSYRQINLTGAEGDLEGDSLPEYAAAIIRKYTSEPGRPNRGRWFIPCVAEINTDNTDLTEPGLGALHDIATVLGETLTDGLDRDWSPQHYNRQDNEYVQIAHTQEVSQLCTQRRRRLRPLS